MRRRRARIVGHATAAEPPGSQDEPECPLKRFARSFDELEALRNEARLFAAACGALRESRASGSAAQAFSAASPLTSSRTRAATMARKSLRAMPGR